MIERTKFVILPYIFYYLFIKYYLCYLFLFVDPVLYSGLILGAFDVLSKRLRLLDEIPLKVSSVQPLDPGLFYLYF